jgi:hypothetical protein
MAGPITWKNVTPIDQSGEVNAYLRAGQQLGQGIAGIGNATNQFVDDRVQAQTDMMTAELLGAGADINAANAIIQKYSTGNFAPTTQSIQKAQNELRSIAEFNDQMAMNDLNRARTEQQMDLAGFAENRARTQEGRAQAAEGRDVERFGWARTEEDRKGTRFDWATTNQQAKEAADADADTKRDLEIGGLQRSATEATRVLDNTAFVDDLASRIQLNPNDPTVLQDLSSISTRNLNAAQIKRINQLGGNIARSNYSLPLDQIAPFIQKDPATGQPMTDSSGRPIFGVSDMTGITPDRLQSLEDSQIRGIQKQYSVTEDEAKKIWQTVADSSGWSTFKTQVGKVKAVAVSDQERATNFETNLKSSGSPEMAILLDVAGAANKEALNWEDDKRGAFMNELNGLLTNLDNDPVFNKIPPESRYEFARRLMNKGNYWNTLGIGGFSIAGDNTFIDTDIKDLDSQQLYDEYKKLYSSESEKSMKAEAEAVMKAIEAQSK